MHPGNPSERTWKAPCPLSPPKRPEQSDVLYWSVRSLSRQQLEFVCAGVGGELESALPLESSMLYLLAWPDEWGVMEWAKEWRISVREGRPSNGSRRGWRADCQRPTSARIKALLFVDGFIYLARGSEGLLSHLDRTLEKTGMIQNEKTRKKM